jgi:hypothetical protein
MSRKTMFDTTTPARLEDVDQRRAPVVLPNYPGVDHRPGLPFDQRDGARTRVFRIVVQRL